MKKLPILLLLTSLAVLAGCSKTATPTDDIPEAGNSVEQTRSAEESSDLMIKESGDAVTGADDSAAMMADATEMTIDMFMFGYSVEEVTVKPGETLKINLTNSEGMHDFDIDELNVDSKVIKAGETETVTFTIPKDATAGTEYAYYCSVGNHRAQGMEGKIIVE